MDEKQRTEQVLLNKFADLKKEMADVYNSLSDEVKHERSVWRPIEKELTLIFLNFQKTFYRKEIAKRAEQKEMDRIDQGIKAQEKIK